MEAPNLERTSSLTWAGMGGLNWDRNLVLPSVDDPQALKLKRSSTAGPRLFEDETPPPVAVVTALLAEDDEVPPPNLLRRSVTFSGDFPHNMEDETLIATPPFLGPNVAQQRQRATSDAAAVKAAWGNEPGSLSPDAAIFSYSPHQKISSRLRTHSLSAEPMSLWGAGSESPRERSRTANTLSVGSPDTEVLEYLDGDDLSFGGREAFGNARSNGGYTSPLQHGLYPSSQSSQSQNNQNRFNAPQGTTRLPTPPFNTFNNPASSVNAPHSTTPPLAMNSSSSTLQSEPPQDPNLLEIQLQNLHAMQQQWMQMMQLQLDQTLFATQQRLQNMQLSSGGTPPLSFSSPKSGSKFQSQNFDNFSQSNSNLIPPPMLYPAANRSSPPAHRQHRRNENSSTNPNGNFPTSSLLAEHKITGRRLTAQELQGHVVEFSRDSHGSRLIQFKMETGTPEERRSFVNEALPQTLSLARDLFGNYVVQNFFDNAAPDQRDLLALSLMGSVNALCTHPHGCRVVQRALFVVSPARRNDLVEELIELRSGNLAQTEAIVRSHARDAHATHVLQKAVAALQRGIGLKSAFKDPPISEDAEDPPVERARAANALEKIESFVLQDCLAMCTHQQACRLVQRILGACEPHNISPRVSQVLTEVFRNIDALAIHQNGNFVLQHILEATDPSLASRVQNYVCTNAVRLARHKFGSHLVEKCLACATPSQVNAIIEKFLSPLTPDMIEEFKDDFESSANDDLASGLVPSTLPVLMKDPYANFVVQKAFDVARGELRAKLSHEIRSRTTSLSKFSYGRHILTHINRANGASSE